MHFTKIEVGNTSSCLEIDANDSFEWKGGQILIVTFKIEIWRIIEAKTLSYNNDNNIKTFDTKTE